MTETGKEAPDHEKLVRHFEEAFDDSTEERTESERDRDYYDGIQLTADEIETLRQRKQPVVISNRIKPKIDSLLGFEKRQRTDPRAFPRTPKHQQEAEAATDALRYVCDQNRFQQIRSDVAENVFIEGCGAATVTMVKRPNGVMDVALTLVPWDRFYRDPHSRARDFSDANYMGVVVWMDESDAKARFKGKEDIIEACYDGASGSIEGETYDDRPRVTWSDKKRRRIRILQHRWLEDGVWMTAILSRAGYLREPQPSPYLDEYGKPDCDIVAVSAYITRENKRYGAVRTMISAQDEINKRRSKALHRLSVRQVIAEHGAVEDVNLAKSELAKPDGYVEVMPDARFEIVNSEQLAMGEMELPREAKAEIDSSGVNPALEGDVKAPSGRAVEALTTAGLAEQAVMFDALRDWSLRVYRQIWNRIRQYWTDERWVRVTDDERNLKWVGINHPVTRGDLAIQQAEQSGDPAMLQQAQAFAQSPEGQMVERVDNQLPQLDVDIILEEGPDSVTIQSEQFDALVELKKADPQAIPTKLVIEASSLRNKDAILEHLEQGGLPPQVAQQMQEMQKQTEELAKALQEAEAKLQDRSLDFAKLEVERYKAETDRIQALRPAPELVAPQVA